MRQVERGKLLEPKRAFLHQPRLGAAAGQEKTARLMRRSRMYHGPVVLVVTLFYRGVREITLTEQGRRLADEIGLAVDRIEAAVVPVMTDNCPGSLKFSVGPLFGNRWLLPRLEKFAALYPELNVMPILSFEDVDSAVEDFDAAVRQGDGG